MRLKKLFKDIDVIFSKGSKDIEITGVCSHSQFVAPGNLFIAKKGGSTFIPEAIRAGAIAIVTDLYNPFIKDVQQIIHPNISEIEPIIVNRYYRFPSSHLLMIGITGTNGKTTSSYLIHHLLNRKESPSGLIGTIECITGKNRFPSQLTTADVVTNQRYLREMVDFGIQSAVMEVTSHGLDQNRVDGIDFDIGIFTNLSQDHLDYHKTMENYASAKIKLFEKMKDPLKTAVINIDDPISEKMIGKTGVKVVTFGVEKKADVKATDISFSLEGTEFITHYQGKSFRVKTPMLGRYNVYNCLAALSVGISQGLEIAYLQKKMQTFPGVPGRLERIQNTKGIYLFVDFAHTEQALLQVLSTLSQIKKNRIITIFGCGGDRDQTKRPMMGEAAEKYSDEMIITSDNPRSEEPIEICRQVTLGLIGKKPFSIEVDRKKAMAMGIEMARPGDIVLIAGRGHEPFQKIGGIQVPFDDREVARKLLF